MWFWFLHVTGTEIQASGSRWYNFWSGFGSDLGEVAIFGAVVGAYHKHNCHAKGCFRIGKHGVDGTPFITCRKHHPALDNRAPSAEDILAAHADAHAD